MTLEELVQRLTDALDKSRVDCVLVGSLAASFYGVSRSTQDAELVVSGAGAEFSDLLRAFGPEFERDPQPGWQS